MENRPIRVLDGQAGITSAAAEDLFAPERAPESDQESRRKPLVRPRTVPIHRIAKRDLARLREEYPDVDHPRPATRADCVHGDFAERPCAYVGCKYHLYLDVNPTNGNIKLNFPDMELDELPETCALDIADRGGMTLEEVGTFIQVTRERVRQMESRVAARLRGLKDLVSLWED